MRVCFIVYCIGTMKSICSEENFGLNFESDVSGASFSEDDDISAIYCCPCPEDALSEATHMFPMSRVKTAVLGLL